MKKYPILAASAALVCASLLLGSCDKRAQDEYYIPTTDQPGDKPLVNPGEIVVVPVSPDNGQGGTVVIPDNATTITIFDAGEDGKTVDPNKETDLEEGTYTVVVVSGANGEPVTGEGTDKIHVNKTGVYVTPAGDGKLPVIPATYGGKSTITVKGNEMTTCKVDQAPLTRDVKVTITINGISADEIESIDVKLYGLSASRNFDDAFATKALTDSRAASGNYAEQVSTAKQLQQTVTFTIFGIEEGQQQILNIVIKTKNGAVNTIEENVTDILKGFNNGNANEPAQLNAAISFGIDGITGTITGWGQGADEDI